MEIKTIGIIGAGTSGPAIAYLTALHGYKTVLQGVSQELLEDGICYIQQTLRDGTAAGTITPQQQQRSLTNLATSRSVEDVCRHADLLIDATQEELEVKLEIFTLFDKFAKPDAILASSSLTIPIADLAEITFRTENCVGLRFGGCVPQAKSLDVIRAADTSDATAKTCEELGRRLGLDVTVIRE